jgi:hypothetical protein
MGEYKRSSRECRPSEFRSDILSSIREAAARHGIDIDSPLFCCETVAERTTRGFFATLRGADPDPTHYIGVVLTPTWLVWARSGLKRGTDVQMAMLKDVTVSDYESRSAEETGVELTGIINNSSERVTAFIGLGTDPASDKFKRALESALHAVKS